jgi:hypothetical protein
MVKEASIIADMIRIPPIVGVPAFPRWREGPSLLITWPAFILARSGITNGPRTAAVRKAIPIAVSEVVI